MNSDFSTISGYQLAQFILEQPNERLLNILATEKNDPVGSLAIHYALHKGIDFDSAGTCYLFKIRDQQLRICANIDISTDYFLPSIRQRTFRYIDLKSKAKELIRAHDLTQNNKVIL